MTGAPAASVRVLYFAALRERVGLSEETVPLPRGEADVATLIETLTQRHPAVAELLMSGELRMAVNERYAHLDSALRAGDEVALFPPVTGG